MNANGESRHVDNWTGKALSLWQPWASLIALGTKRIETRSWSTKYRGPLAIHASKHRPSAADFGDTMQARAGWIGRYNLGRWAETLVHASPCDCDLDEEIAGERCLAEGPWEHALFDDAGAHGFSLATTLPLGAVVAVCSLAEIVPMVAERPSIIDTPPGRWLQVFEHSDTLIMHSCDGYGLTSTPVTDQRPYGDFAPGRFAWILDYPAAVVPVPMKGRQGLWTVDLDLTYSGRTGA